MGLYFSSMCYSLLLILVFQTFVYCAETEPKKQSPWRQRSRIEITFKSSITSNSSIDHNVRSLFSDYAIRNGITLEEVSTSYKRLSGLGISIEKANVMDCHEFQIYLYDLGPQRYCVKTGHVKCNRMASTICLWYTCSDKDYKDVTSCI